MPSDSYLCNRCHGRYRSHSVWPRCPYCGSRPKGNQLKATPAESEQDEVMQPAADTGSGETSRWLDLLLNVLRALGGG